MTIQVHSDVREEKFQQLKNLGRELHIPIPEIFVETKLINPETPEIIEQQRSHTYVRNFYNMLLYTVSSAYSTSTTYGAGYLGLKGTGEIASTVTALVSSGNVNPGANASYGIVVGSGDAAYSFEDYQLNTLIAHGTGSGQLSYVAMTTQTSAYDSGSKTWTQNVVRIFNNNSSGSITVKEVGIYHVSGWYFGIIRDVLISAKTVAPGGQLTVTYTFTLTYPA